MELLSNLAMGFGVASTAPNLLYALAGCMLGSVIGVLPGLSSLTAIALVLPLVHGLAALPALIVLAGVFAGTQYGRSTARVLTPPGGSLGAGVASALLAGTVALALSAALVAPLVLWSFSFGGAEWFALLGLALIGVVAAAPGSLLKALAMAVLGLLLGQINAEAVSGSPHPGLAIPALAAADGVGFALIALGVFGCGEVVARLAAPLPPRESVRGLTRSNLWPTRQGLKQALPAALRGAGLGALLGGLPGVGALASSLAAFRLERRHAASGARAGFGAQPGVLGRAAAVVAATQSAYLPTLVLGIPPNAAMALLLGALTIKGLPTGPQLMAAEPALFWGLIASMWLVHAMLAVLTLAGAGLWLRLMRVPDALVFPLVTVACCVGAYGLTGSAWGVYAVAVCTVAGYALRRLGCDPVPLLVGFIVGPLMREQLRRALQAAHGDWARLIARPVTVGLLALAALLVLVVMLPALRKRRDAAGQVQA